MNAIPGIVCGLSYAACGVTVAIARCSAHGAWRAVRACTSACSRYTNDGGDGRVGDDTVANDNDDDGERSGDSATAFIEASDDVMSGVFSGVRYVRMPEDDGTTENESEAPLSRALAVLEHDHMRAQQ
jgi:hypothetical protein